MQLKIKELLTQQIVFLLLPVIFLIVGILGVLFTGNGLYVAINKHQTTKTDFVNKTQKKENLEHELERKLEEEKEIEFKQIVEFEGDNIGAEASFAPLFEDMLSIAKYSGLRIRSVQRNFEPGEDPIFKAQKQGINVCELNMAVVGNYAQIQSFMKSLIAQNYLVNFVKVELISWKRDKSILIANLTLRFYTKTK